MCLGIPGRIVEIWDEPSGARMAHVEFPTERSGPETRRLCLAYPPDLVIGDHTIARAEFALTRIDEAAALVTPAGYGVFGVEQAEAS